MMRLKSLSGPMKSSCLRKNSSLWSWSCCKRGFSKVWQSRRNDHRTFYNPISNIFQVQHEDSR
jgi:hypothetical protein